MEGVRVQHHELAEILLVQHLAVRLDEGLEQPFLAEHAIALPNRLLLRAQHSPGNPQLRQQPCKGPGDHLVPGVVRRVAAHQPQHVDRARLLGKIQHADIQVFGPIHALPRRSAQHVAVLEDVLERLLEFGGRLEALLHGRVAQGRPEDVGQFDAARAALRAGVAGHAHPQRGTGQHLVQVSRGRLQDQFSRRELHGVAQRAACRAHAALHAAQRRFPVARLAQLFQQFRSPRGFDRGHRNSPTWVRLASPTYSLRGLKCDVSPAETHHDFPAMGIKTVVSVRPASATC